MSGYFRRSIFTKTNLIFEHVPEKSNTHKVCKDRFKKDSETFVFVVDRYKSRKIRKGKLEPTEEIKYRS